MALVTPSSPDFAIYNELFGMWNAGLAGGALTAGYAVYRNLLDSRKLAYSNCGAAATARVDGLLVEGGVLDDPLRMITRGPMYFGSGVLSVGTTYYLAPTNGRICLLSDLGSGDKIIEVGSALTTSILDVRLRDTGTEVP